MFVFKQKTAYVMRISDWSSDVCSSDLSAVLATRGPPLKLGLREAYLLTAGLWFLLPLVAALPFMWAAPHLSPTDAYFEAVSGLPATGGPVPLRLSALPPGILLDRKSVSLGKGGSVSVDLVGRRLLKKK